MRGRRRVDRVDELARVGRRDVRCVCLERPFHLVEAQAGELRAIVLALDAARFVAGEAVAQLLVNPIAPRRIVVGARQRAREAALIEGMDQLGTNSQNKR